MAGSRRKYRRSKAKVRVALPRKNPKIFKPAFAAPPKLRALIGDSSDPKWDDQGLTRHQQLIKFYLIQSEKSYRFF